MKTGFDYLIWDAVHKTMNHAQIAEAVDQAIRVCYAYGFHIAAFICDGAAANRKYQTQYYKLQSTRASVGVPTHTPHPITQKPIYFIPDPSHVVQKLWNSLDNPSHCIRLTHTGHDVDPRSHRCAAWSGAHDNFHPLKILSQKILTPGRKSPRGGAGAGAGAALKSLS
ncbi:hypothetical protein B484DRAFT_403976 [Ochromonadaceae sp. CCMP2298]|nr:hypothetical protein B484DRAFT_403976 [Ochromonadaceae sp. CCMP2298]